MLRKSAPMLVALRGLASAFSPFRNLGGKPVPFAPMPGFPASAVGVADVLAAPKWPAEWPYSPRDFTRGDESPDPYFYDQPRFCFHVDDAAVGALTEFYGTALREWDKPAILDICASHVSHFPADIADFAGNRVALGMNEEELKNNTQVDSYVVKDLNEDPTLPFEDNSFDVVTNVVSIDYLTKPLAICKEIRRVLKPGGQAVMALSNRCFPSKAVDEKANKDLDLARTRNKDVAVAENRQSEACSTFEKLSISAKSELAMQKKGRVEHMRSNLQQLVELEVKNGKAHSEVLRQAIRDIREM